MVLAGKLFKETQQKLMNMINSSNYDLNNSDVNDDTNDDAEYEEPAKIRDFNENFSYDQIVEIEASLEPVLVHIRCAAHIFHLTVLAMKKFEYKN